MLFLTENYNLADIGDDFLFNMGGSQAIRGYIHIKKAIKLANSIEYLMITYNKKN